MKAATLGAAATAALAVDAQVPKRTLGKTGLQVSIIGTRRRKDRDAARQQGRATQAQLDLDQSLSHFSTDRIDLYQIHNVINDEDIEFIFGPKGVMEMVEKAKKAGKKKKK